ncbi:hypothetical protein BDK51DRAFT_36484 [Blyttiomyces helicus]|uniref:Uncharacterized protein n=1 Tax=Blyttiomyces helicus TaxID=388810 RepID=A0A4P9WLG6_9FUNG|nr:hypothetical protein BDK51DRAFT_36484 [Blyttiomyces helicus]|eukprot:RKO93714.1 hypothetical protein BDK51DRAFT_36484 [Blyttiomyces helicus]
MARAPRGRGHYREADLDGGSTEARRTNQRCASQPDYSVPPRLLLPPDLSLTTVPAQPMHLLSPPALLPMIVPKEPTRLLFPPALSPTTELADEPPLLRRSPQQKRGSGSAALTLAPARSRTDMPPPLCSRHGINRSKTRGTGVRIPIGRAYEAATKHEGRDDMIPTA